MKPNINVDEITELVSVLNSMEHRIEDFSIPLTDAARLMEIDVEEAFATGGTNLGLNWAEHAEGTIERHGEHPFGWSTGNLFASKRVFVRPFVAGVEFTAPHAHLFEHGRHGMVSIASSGGTIKRPHSAAFPGDLVQPEREFLEITEVTSQKGIDLLLDFAVRDIAA